MTHPCTTTFHWPDQKERLTCKQWLVTSVRTDQQHSSLSLGSSPTPCNRNQTSFAELAKKIALQLHERCWKHEIFKSSVECCPHRECWPCPPPLLWWRCLLRASPALSTRKIRPPLTGSCPSLCPINLGLCCISSSPMLCRGWQGLVAYASHSTVVVVDPRTIQPIQTLSAHKSNVIKVGDVQNYGWSHVMNKSWRNRWLLQV